MKAHLIVLVGAGLGGMSRHAVNAVAMRLGASFPWHTLIVNVTGSLLMGLLVGGANLQRQRTTRVAPDRRYRRAWRLHDILGVLTRRGTALGAARPFPVAALRPRIGRVVHRDAVFRHGSVSIPVILTQSLNMQKNHRAPAMA